ncbi:MAG: TlpA family protein disulfide reductase [Dehalococcoidia bacterium]
MAGEEAGPESNAHHWTGPWPRLALGLGGVGILALVFAFLVLRGGDDDGANGSGSQVVLGVLEPARPEIGKPAPDFALIDTRDGKTVRHLSDYRGTTVVLNWFASWCGPCAAEIPDFQEAYEALDGEIVVLAVNLQESRETASGMLEGLGATFPSVLDTNGAVAQHYRLLGMPTTFFIDKDGIVQMSGSGRITAETLKDELAKLGHEY